MRMLDSMMAWVEEVPPLPQENQRFGNLAFRKYIKLVEEVCICSARAAKTPLTPADTP